MNKNFSKKDIRRLLVNKLNTAVSKLANGNKVSKRLNRKIKKAGKLISEGIFEDLKEGSKANVEAAAKVKSPKSHKTEEKNKKSSPAAEKVKDSTIKKTATAKKAAKKTAGV